MIAGVCQEGEGGQRWRLPPCKNGNTGRKASCIMYTLYSSMIGGIMELFHAKTDYRLKIRKIITGFIIKWSQPLWASIFFFVIFLVITIYEGGLFRSSIVPYYNYLADAFLHGQLSLRLVPPTTHDLILYQDKYFLYWPPFPAILMLPFVALFGVGFSDVLFTLLLAVIDVALIAATLQEIDNRGLIALSRFQRGSLVIFFAFGTMFTPLVPNGKVWFTGQLVSLACVGLTYWAVLRYRGWKAFLLAGLGMAAAFATRNSVILVGIFPAWFLLREHWEKRWWHLIKLTAISLTPILIAIISIGLYNLARFGNMLEIGYQFHQMGSMFRPLYGQYGAFNIHYLATNLYYQFIHYPIPWHEDTLMGGSLFLLSPLFFAALWSLWQDRRKLLTWVLAATIVIAYIPIGLLMGTGYAQFGPRYLLDLVIPLLMLTAQGERRWPARVVTLLIGVSILQYFYGMLIFLVAG